VKKKIIISSIIALIIIAFGSVGVWKLASNAKVNSNIKLGNKYFKQGRYRESVYVFQKVNKSKPKNVDGIIGLFKGYTAIRDKKSAENLLKDSIKLIPDKKLPYLYLARFYAEDNRAKDALLIMDKCYSNIKENSIKSLFDRCKAQPGNIVTFLNEELSNKINNRFVQLLSSPVINNPIDGEVYGKSNINIAWNKIPDALNYFVAVRDITSGKKIVDDVNVKKNTNYSVSSSLLTNEHNYCISVGAKYSKGDERWNENVIVTISSTKAENQSLSSSPVITYPVSGQAYRKNNMNITWNDVEGAKEYSISILDVTAGNQLIDNYSIGLHKNYNLSGSQLTEGHFYRISVAAKSAKGEEKWSEVGISISDGINQTPTEPLDNSGPMITMPINGKSYDKTDINIGWNSVKEASEYILTVIDLSSKATIINNQNLGKGLVYTLKASLLTGGHNYKILVGAKNPSGDVKWSELTISILKPQVSIQAPIITAPINGNSYNKDDVLVAWKSVEGAVEYIITVTDNGTGVNFINNYSIGKELSYTIPSGILKEGISYKVKVSAKDSAGNIKSSEVSFKINSSQTTKIEIISPLNGGIYNKGDIGVSWTKVSNAAYYFISVREDSGTEIVKGVNVGLRNSYVIQSELFTSGHKYTITVKAMNSEGNELSRDESVITIVDKGGKH